MIDTYSHRCRKRYSFSHCYVFHFSLFHFALPIFYNNTVQKIYIKRYIILEESKVMTHEEVKNYILNAMMLGDTVNPEEVIDRNPYLLVYECEHLRENLYGSVCIDNFIFKLNDRGEIILTYYIGEYAELDLGDTVDIIGPYAFYRNTDIRKVYGNSVKEVGDAAFQYSKIEVVNFPNLKEVGVASFYSSALREINAPKVSYIKYYTFNSCKQLSRVDIQACLGLEACAFQDCTNLSTVSIPKCQTIEHSAFSGCINLRKLEIQRDTVYRDNTFDGCKKLKFT